MKACAIEKYGDSSVVQIRSLPEPAVADDEVLIAVKAASINPVDFKIRNGKLRQIVNYDFPLILGNDCSGIILETGSKVRRFKTGDAVYVRRGKGSGGTFAERTTAHESELAHKPGNLTFEEAAGIPLVGLTAWQAMVVRGQLQPGQHVFIPAGSGGVGSFAIQLAHHLGARVSTTTSTKNVDFVRSLGADRVIDYTREEFSGILNDVDLVFDTLGGQTQAKAFACLRPGGRVISIVGPPTLAFAREAGLGPLIRIGAYLLGRSTHARARRHHAFYEFFMMSPDGAQLAEIGALIEAGTIKPVVDRVYPLDRARDALDYVETGRARGKVILAVEDVQLPAAS